MSFWRRRPPAFRYHDVCTGARDSVVPEVTGLLIPPGYPEAIVEAVVKLLRDPELRLRMGNAARAWVQQNFVDERVLSSSAAFYKGMLAAANQSSFRNVVAEG